MMPDQPNNAEPRLELDEPTERAAPIETERIAPILLESSPEPAAPRRHAPMTARQRWTIGVLLTLGFGGVIGMVVYFQLGANPDAKVKQGWAAVEKKDWDVAIRSFTEAIELRREYGNAYVGRGRAFEGKGAYDQARADYAEAIRIDPRDPNGYLGRASCLERQHAYHEALADCASAKLTEWQSPFILDTLAAAYAEAGQFAEAVKWQKKSLEFPEPNPEELAKAQERLKLYEEGKPVRDE
jgi:tetratricopeptide (TPR) repeat protein